MKKTSFFLSLLIAAAILPSIAMAADAGAGTNLVGAALQESTTQVMNHLTGVAFKLLFALSMLKFVIKGYGLMQDGEIESGIGTAAKFMVWTSFVVWLMTPSASPVRDGLSNGADFIQRTVDWTLGFASTMSGGSENAFDAGYIFNLGLNASHNLIVAVATAATGSVANIVVTAAMPITGLFSALMLMVMNLLILIAAGGIAIKVFMVKIDAAIVIAISPLSFALNGLDALREQGMAPFKNLLTILYRILILAAIVSAMKTVSDNLSNVLDTTAAAGGLTDIWSPIAAAIFCYLILLYLAHRSDAIAQGLSSGSSMFGSGDLASSVAAGVAAGAAIATGGAAVAAAGSKAGQTMSDVIKSMNAEGSITNAGGTGAGGARPFDQEPVGVPPAGSLNPSTPSPSAMPDSSFPIAGPAAPIRSRSAPRSSGTPGASEVKSVAGAAPSGPGETAGIGGSGSGTDQKLDKLFESLSQPKKPSFSDRMSALNDHVAREQTTVQANVNVNAHDH